MDMFIYLHDLLGDLDDHANILSKEFVREMISPACCPPTVVLLRLNLRLRFFIHTGDRGG